MKTLNDFKKENKDLEKLEMTNTQGGLANGSEPRLTAEDDSNWNCGDVETCYDMGGGSRVCFTTQLPG